MQQHQKQDRIKEKPDAGTMVSAPVISLPKGGGAIRGIGEKFAANPVTGTGSMTVPIAISPGRSGFGPQLSLSYDSGSGNGVFGLGWSLSIPCISRKTDKGLPRYKDAKEADVFILSGAEDLVPVYRQDLDGSWIANHPGFGRDPEMFWVCDPDGKLVVHEDESDGYLVRRYRPRIEGLFARIERWTSKATGEIHWRSISKDNVTTLYGKDNWSRIFDPVDLDPSNPTDLAKAHPTRIFSWLICQSYDDKGNAIIYEYEPENSKGIDITQAHESNRTELNRSTNRYLKRIKYGNRKPNRDADWKATDPVQLTDWMFEVVFDYLSFETNQTIEGQHFKQLAPDAAGQIYISDLSIDAAKTWGDRQDPFSVYRAGFEMRTYRLCQRILMFHHFPQELGVKDYLVRTTEFSYVQSPVASFINSITQSGYVLQQDQAHRDQYLKKSLPPIEFSYSQVPTADELTKLQVRDVDSKSLENLPVGLDGGNYQWMDLDGEGTSGILTEQADGWFYKRNLSANNLIIENGVERTVANFGATEVVAQKPASGLASGGQFLDLAGDGQVDLAQMEGDVRGFYERTTDNGWESFQTFKSWPNVNTHDPNLKFVDLTGDGHADILITEGEALTWYPSLAEEGFGEGIRLSIPIDEEKGPRLVFADGTQSIYLADFSGDGLSDLARIRNGEVCYWPNLGYGRFGPKITMDNSPLFDEVDQFDQKRIRLVDTDGSGTTDMLYLHRHGVNIYFNHSGNRWSDRVKLPQFPPIDNISTVQALDLLGNGTACLVWSSPLPGNNNRQMRYIALMEEKPHLLVSSRNNLGAETKVNYAPSTKFYLDDKQAGRPWITRLPFPVHVVERVETFDYISRNHFVTRYAYHHGYFDGVEREFRGFGMVEQWDTDEFNKLDQNATNVDASWYTPPVHTKTWFHTGAYFQGKEISLHLAHEYFGAPQDTVAFEVWAKENLLDDTVLPEVSLTADEIREACRSLKGAMLRQEIYADDDSDKKDIPYTVTEQNFTIKRLQPCGDNQHAVFFTHPREVINYHYERNLSDPRVQHALTLEVDDYGNVRKSLAIGYGRRQGQSLLQEEEDKRKQEELLITYTENDVTRSIDNTAVYPNDYRSPLPSEARTYEVTGLVPDGASKRFDYKYFTANKFDVLVTLHEIDYQEPRENNKKQKKLIERVRTLYRKDNFSGLLGKDGLEPMALPGESYKLAFTKGLLDAVFVRNGQKLLPADSADVLGGGGEDHGSYVDLDNDERWWIPSGRMYFSPEPSHTSADELAFARTHFFLPHRYRDPFHTDTFKTESFVTYDIHSLLMLITRDALGNQVTVGERAANGDIDLTKPGNDYRVLQPWRVMDPNRNRTQVAFDALGMVVATAVMGKPEETKGDNLNLFEADLAQQQIDDFHNAPDTHTIAPTLLKNASTRIIYDLHRFYHSKQAYPNAKDIDKWEAPYAATLARETHVSDPLPPQGLKIQISFSYSDGFGREIQKKIQAEAGLVPKRDPVTGKIIVKADNQPEMTKEDVSLRWVGSGWTVFNNKGKPVRQYEPFFTDRHHFEFDVQIGVSPILFYDPMERVVATLHPNHTWEKVVFDPWQQETWDVNDTVVTDPLQDNTMKGFYLDRDNKPRLPSKEYLPSWHDLRTNPTYINQFTEQYPDTIDRQNETNAAKKAFDHSATFTVAHFDALGRPFLTVVHNKVKCRDHALDGKEEKYHTRVELDIERNQRSVRDAIEQAGDKLGRVVMRYDYDMLGNRIHQSSMEAGERWTLNDVSGKPLYAWDSRNHQIHTKYDQLRRPIETLLREGAGGDALVGQTVHGETAPNAEANNLRTRVFQVFDQAGKVTSEVYDFKGNLLRSQRQLAKSVTIQGVKTPAYKVTLNWLGGVELDSEIFTSRTAYDALNRPIQLIAPHSNRPQTKLHIIQPGYNEANLLEKIHVWYKLDNEPATVLDVATANMPAVTDIDYDAKGQRVSIDYGNGVKTTYTYDPLTFRLTHLFTVRGGNYPQACASELTDLDRLQLRCPKPTPVCRGVQNLHYTYDPAGNITHIRDDAQQTVFFRNRCVEPSAEYTYDAIYRLIRATGREHLGQMGGSPVPHSHNDAGRTGILTSDGMGNFSPNDGNAMGTYIEHYVYDAVGDFLEMQHRGSDPVHPGWTRYYTYNEPSQLEPAKMSNRLSQTQVGNGITSAPEPYAFDAHGNMTFMPHLGGAHPNPNMHWDYKDQLCHTDLAGGGTAYYVYDATGQRVRKVWEKSPNLIEERIYLGGFEIFRRWNGIGGLWLERETLHVMDDKQRIALIEIRTLDLAGNDRAPERLIRYQLSNHLGSTNLEVTDKAQIISYEEYTPYGSTVYQAVCSWAEISKRYRNTGKERDNENGLYYFGNRYYISWVGRWTSPDPAGLRDGVNSYHFAQQNPIVYVDKVGLQAQKVLALGLYERTIEVGGKQIKVPAGIGKELVRASAQESIPNAHVIDITEMPSWKEMTELLSGKNRPQDKFAGIRSGVVVQEAFERGYSIHFDIRGVDLAHRGSETSSELASVINELAGGKPRVDIYIRSEKGLSIVQKGTTIVKGVPLPKEIAQHLPQPTKYIQRPPILRPGIIELDPKPSGGSYVIIGAEVIHNLAESVHATREHESWKTTLVKGPSRSLARFIYETVEGAKMTPELIGKGIAGLLSLFQKTAEMKYKLYKEQESLPWYLRDPRASCWGPCR